MPYHPLCAHLAVGQKELDPCAIFLLLAAATGGTFTDIVVFDQRTKATQFGKTLTNYQDLVAGVLDGLSE